VLATRPILAGKSVCGGTDLRPLLPHRNIFAAPRKLVAIGAWPASVSHNDQTQFLSTRTEYACLEIFFENRVRY
jgi:hypothetical protein